MEEADDKPRPGSHFPIGLAICTTLLVVVVTIWIRSPKHADVLAFFTPAGHLEGIGSDDRGVLFFASDIPFGREMGLSLEPMSGTREEFRDLDAKIFNSSFTPRDFFGFRAVSGTWSLPGTLTPAFSAVLIPYWFLSIVLVLPTAALGTRLLQRWRRRRGGLCTRCGYDLRATTSDVCPECGSAVCRSRRVMLQPTPAPPG